MSKDELRGRSFVAGAPRRSAPALKEHTYLPPRLRDVLKRGFDAGFTQVQAAAGCGKTAGVLQFLVDESIDPLWYTCGPDDAEPSYLLAGLIRALGRAESLGGKTALAALASRDVRQAYRASLKPLLDELAEGDETGDVLVIDDADVVGQSPLSLEVLDYALFALSSHVRIFLLSRADLALPSLAKARLEGRVIRVDSDDLLLRQDEVAECARVTYNASLSSEEAAHLFRVTAGWGIALRLAIHLRELGNSVAGSDDTPFTPEAQADLFAYLASEVLSRVDARIADFLRRTAVLETLDPAICGRMTGEAHPTELIQSLSRAGLPVMKAGWSTYRCHSLLRSYFVDSMSEDQRLAAHREAGFAYAEVRDWPRALLHLVAAGDINGALGLVDTHGRELFYTGHGRALLDLVKSAPPDLLVEHYAAEYWAAFAASRLLELEWATASFERVHNAAASAGDTAMTREALRSLSQVLLGWGRYAAATEVAQRLLATIPVEDMAGRAAVTLGYLTTGMGATSQFREAIDLTRALLPNLALEPRPSASSEAYARAVSAVTVAFEGDFASARAELSQAQLLISGLENDDVTTFIPWYRALVEFQAGNLGGADDAARLAEEMALRFGDLQRVLECRAILASTEVLRGNVDAADKGFAALDELRGGGPDFWGTTLTLLSRPHRYRLHGDLAAARGAADANHALAVATSSAWFVCSTRLDVANFRLLSGDAEGAREPARMALTEATALSADILLFGAHLMVAATHAEDEAEAMAVALRIADDRDYRFLMPYGVRLRQLDAALWRALGTAAAGRAGILLQSTGPAATAALHPLLADLDEPAALNAVEVLREYGAHGRDILTRLTRTSNRRVAAASKEALATLDAANPHGLSRREVEVLQLLVQGLRTKDVAERLVLTPATVSTHIQRIMSKTGTTSRAELLALAARELPSAVAG